MFIKNKNKNNMRQKAQRTELNETEIKQIRLAADGKTAEQISLEMGIKVNRVYYLKRKAKAIAGIASLVDCYNYCKKNRLL